MDHSGIFGASVYGVGTYVRIGDNQGFENDYRRNNRVVNRMAEKELFGNSEQLEKDHVADLSKIEGWDKNEYLNLIRELLNSIGNSEQLEKDHVADLSKIEGWDKNEYLNLIRELLNSIGGKDNG